MTKKSYNKEALRGGNVDDKEWQADMFKLGVQVPDDLLYTPDGPRFALAEIKKMNRDHYLSEGLTESVAEKSATGMYNRGLKDYENLLKKTK